jgi:hypothetical protein
VAQVSDGIIDATVGKYRLSQSGSAKVCNLTLTREGSIGGYEVIVPKGCSTFFPALGDGAVWGFDGKGGLRLANTLRKTIAVFEENEGEPLIAHRPKGVIWTLAMLNPPKPLTAGQQMSGKWKVAGIGGEPVFCKFVFASKDGKSGTAQPQPGCSKAYGAITTWSIKNGRLTAKGKAGGVLASFKRGDVVTFEQMATGNDSVYLSKDFD